MAEAGYVAQIWEDGVSLVNAERLNEMERGIELGVNLAQEALDSAGGSGGGSGSGEPFVITLGGGNPASGLPMDKSYDEILAQINAGNAANMYMIWDVDGTQRYYLRPSFTTTATNAVVFSSIGVNSYGELTILAIAAMPDPSGNGDSVAMVMEHVISNA